MPSIRDIMLAMPAAADAQKVGGVNATIQFSFSGEEPGEYTLRVQNGAVTVDEGVTANPDATLSTPSEVWKGIAAGEVNPISAFMSGKIKASGNMALLMQMQGWFNAAR